MEHPGYPQGDSDHAWEAHASGTVMNKSQVDLLDSHGFGSCCGDLVSSAVLALAVLALGALIALRATAPAA